jgi:hypothetical protein
LRHFELPLRLLLNLERILQRMHIVNVGGTVGIDQRPHSDKHVARAHFDDD